VEPGRDLPGLYLGTTEQLVLEDLAAAARVLGLAADYVLGFALHEVRIDGLRLLDLRATSGREAVGLLDAGMVDDDRTACQRVGRSAWEAGLQGVLAPSVTGAGLVLAVFSDRAPLGAIAVHRSSPLPQH
jgi:RES domain-containing protein